MNYKSTNIILACLLFCTCLGCDSNQTGSIESNNNIQKDDISHEVDNAMIIEGTWNENMMVINDGKDTIGSWVKPSMFDQVKIDSDSVIIIEDYSKQIKDQFKYRINQDSIFKLLKNGNEQLWATIEYVDSSQFIYSFCKTAGREKITMLCSNALRMDFLEYKNDLPTMTELNSKQFSSSTNSVYLAGTMALPSTNNQLKARSFDVCLASLTASSCENTIEAREGEHYSYISDIDEINDTISLIVKTIDYCSYSFLGDMTVQNDSTINLIYHAYGNSHSACECEHTLHYKLITNCLLEDRLSKNLKAFVLNGSERIVLRNNYIKEK